MYHIKKKTTCAINNSENELVEKSTKIRKIG